MKRYTLLAGLLAAAPTFAQDSLSILDDRQLIDLLKNAGTRAAELEFGADDANGDQGAGSEAESARTEVRATTIELPIQFRKNSAELDVSELRQIEALCTALLTLDDLVVRLVGHTDASGSDDYNLQLSFSRAASVRRYLTTECGIPAVRIQINGSGETELLPGYPSNHPIHRRVQVEPL